MKKERRALQLIQEGKLNQAEDLYRELIYRKEVSFEVYGNLAAICAKNSNWEEAKLLLKNSLKINPEYSEAYSNLGLSYFETGNILSSIKCYKKALYFNKLMPEALTNLGNVYSKIGDLELAYELQKKAISIRENDIDILTNLGLICFQKNQISDAIFYYNKALGIKRTSPKTLYNLGYLYEEESEIKRALFFYKEALLYDKDSASIKAAIIHCEPLICDWSEINTRNKWLEKLGLEGEPINPYLLLAAEDNPYKQLVRSKRFFKKQFYRPKKEIKKEIKEKIRIGYFSANYYQHPVMILISGLFENHDKSSFEIYAYSYGAPIEDIYTEKVRKNVNKFRDIRNLNDSIAADLARSDKLDIAIDLTGYTKHARLSIFSIRVAPIQISYLGYPGTIGSNCFDYLIADRTLINNNKRFYSEKIIYMTYCYQCNDGKREPAKNKFNRKDLYLPENSFVFTCFNSNFKISCSEFNIWMQLLDQVKGSVLWLYKTNSFSEINLKLEAKKRGIDPARIIFAENMNISDHLARHLHGDLFLDTFNYNAHTTAADSLWSGLPILTKAGKSFSSRVCASLLFSLNLSELITYSEGEYHKKALWLASNPTALKQIKRKLIKEIKNSFLFDTSRFTSELESNFKYLINQERKNIESNVYI